MIPYLFEKTYFEPYQIDIEMLIKSAEANTRFGDINSASRDYQLAVKMLDKQSKCKDCI